MRIATVLGLAVTISVAPTLVRSATEPPSPVPVVSASALPASAAPLAMTTLFQKGRSSLLPFAVVSSHTGCPLERK